MKCQNLLTGGEILSESKNPLMDKQVIQAFSDGVVRTLTTMTKTVPIPGKPFVDKKYQTKGVVAGMIGMVSGEIKGNLTISFGKDAALTICNSMTGDKHTEVNDQILDAIGEITNIIYGCSRAVLNEHGYAFQMAIPIVIEGHKAVISMHSGATLVLPFTADGHPFYVEIIVQHKPS